MPKFTGTDIDRIIHSCNLRWANPIKFPSRKVCIREVDYTGEYECVILSMEKRGLPLQHCLTPENSSLHTPEFWEPLGIACSYDSDMVSFSVLDPDGEIPSYVNLVLKTMTCIRRDRRSIKRARMAVMAAVEQYRRTVQALMGEAGIYSISDPEITFIDYGERPTSGSYFNCISTSARGSVAELPLKAAHYIDRT